MSGQDMSFLDARSFVAGDADAVIDNSAQLAAGSAGKAHGDKFLLAGHVDGAQNVWRVSAGADGEGNVVASPNSVDLAGEDIVKGIIVAHGGQDRRIGCESPTGEAGTLTQKPSAEFRGQVLGVGGAAAVPEEQDLVSGTQALGHSLGNVNHRG
jgi:hypothetical protein